MNKFWTLFITLFLVGVMVIGLILIWPKHNQGRLLEIHLATPAAATGNSIYIGGAVSNPGFYPLKNDDTIETLLQTVGGSTGDPATSLSLLVRKDDTIEAQEIDINRADAWLLEALPGIGNTEAQAIVDYRRENGLFLNTNELTKVAGINSELYEEIKDLVTVAD